MPRLPVWHCSESRRYDGASCDEDCPSSNVCKGEVVAIKTITPQPYDHQGLAWQGRNKTLSPTSNTCPTTDHYTHTTTTTNTTGLRTPSSERVLPIATPALIPLSAPLHRNTQPCCSTTPSPLSSLSSMSHMAPLHQRQRQPLQQQARHHRQWRQRAHIPQI